jgi:hypothetical protein
MNAPKSSNIKGPIEVNVGQNDALVAKMQQFINERENPGFLGSIAEGLNAGVATTRGPDAFNRYKARKQAEEQQLLDYYQTLGAYQAAGEQAKRNAEDYASKMGTTGGTQAAPGTYGGVPLDEYIKAQLNNDPNHDRPILEKWLAGKSTELTKAENNPASLDRKPVVILNPNTKQPEVRDVNMFEYFDLKKKGFIKQPSEYYESKTPTATTGETTDIVPKLQSAVYATESSSGKADTTKPGIQGAIGPMQVTSDTFDTAKRLKLIPPDYEINNPVQNKDTGDRLLAYYQNKYQNPDKALAAYFGGEGAINPDGTINLERKDKLGTSIGQYIAMNKAKAGLAGDLNAPDKGVQLASTAQGFPDVAAMLAERKIREEEGTAAAKKRGESIEEKRTQFETDIIPANVIEEKETNKRIQVLVKENPQIAGVLAGEGYAKAVAGQLERGIGNVKVNDLSTAILQTLPDTKNLTMTQRNELGNYLARMELKAAKLIKGQGQITEGEREILQRASSSLKDPAEAIYKKAKMLERIADLNAELGEIYGDGSKYPNFRQFVYSKDPKVLAIHARYQKDLENILNEKVNFTRPVSGQKPAAHPQDIQDIIKRNQANK